VYDDDNDDNDDDDDDDNDNDIDDDDDVETKVFSSGDKTMHCTGSLWCSATKIFFGH